MAGGLAQPQLSSEAWPAMGFQAENALNGGWIPDQRADGAGGFITNASPLSAPGGLTSFVSTGDGTLFYTQGRALQVIQAAGTVITTVGLSSFAAGLTTIYLNQFSTQTGLSTTLTTGVITSAAASPITVKSTSMNIFSGAISVIPTTGDGSVLTMRGAAGNAAVAVGNSAAQSGALRMANNATITYRNAAGGADQDIFKLSNTDVVAVGNGGALLVQVNNTIGLAVTNGTVASSGMVRLPNSAIAIVGKTSTGGDDIIFPQQQLTTYLTADTTAFAKDSFVTTLSLALPVGTWLMNGAWTATSTQNVAVSGAALGARIHDGTNAKASAWLDVGTQLFANTTGAGASLHVSAVVSHTTALTYTLQALCAGSTLVSIAASVPGPVASTQATYLTAVKIG